MLAKDRRAIPGGNHRQHSSQDTGYKTAPGEMRGPSIRGGTEVALVAGDVLHIPAKVAHQMKLDPGKQVTYFVTKVVE